MSSHEFGLVNPETIQESISAGKDAVAPRLRAQIESQDVFLAALTRERKRSERSGRAFLLVLMSGPEKLGKRNSGAIWYQLAQRLSHVIRDIDIVGWYENRKVMGIIFTELASGEPGVVNTITERLQSALGVDGSDGSDKYVNLSSHVFNDERDNVVDGLSATMRFYPEVRKRERAHYLTRFGKRLMDILGSGLALVLLSPLFLIVAGLVKCTSKGPVFFRQTRIGQYGEPFTFLKFRSMYVDNDPEIHREYVTKLIEGKSDGDQKIFKIKNDPRVTRVGEFLRKSSMDELPQFLNVFKGEMSLVGPRPPIPYEVEKYAPWHVRRLLEAKPGITGLWQVSGRSRTSFDEMVRLDLKYVAEASLLLDLKILLQTPRAVVSGDGAY